MTALRRNATPLCHCGALDTGTEHWSRCYVCHPEQHQGSLVGCCNLHQRIGAQCDGVAIYAGIVALGEWARAMQSRRDSLLTCSGRWVGGSGGHRKHEPCNAIATWSAPTDIYAYCDEHVTDDERDLYIHTPGGWSE